MIITPKDWKTFQHYKDRSPAWIKLHRELLNNYDFWCLPIASRALAPCLWLLASEYEDGKITASLDELAFRFRMTRGEVGDALAPLIERGFFNASEPLANCKQAASPEKRREETERETEEEKRQTRARADDWPEDHQEQFWSLYPNKVGKPKALAKLDLCHKRGVSWVAIMDGLRAYIHSKPPDRQWLNPETFLNQERWADQPAAVSNGKRNVLDAADDLIAKLRSLDEPAPDGLCDRAGETAIRLLPPSGRG